MGLLAEALVPVALTFVLAIPVFLVVSQVIVAGTTIALIAWTMSYARRVAKRGQEAALARQAAPSATA